MAEWLPTNQGGRGKIQKEIEEMNLLLKLYSEGDDSIAKYVIERSSFQNDLEPNTITCGFFLPRKPDSFMRIVLDAMGGDNAPFINVAGALQYLKDSRAKAEVTLVGDSDAIQRELDSYPRVPKTLSIQHSTETVSMDDSPTRSFKEKPDSSLRVAVEMVRDGKGDAIISAGNTGAIMAYSLLTLGRIKGVDRPGVGAFMPHETGTTLLKGQAVYIAGTNNSAAYPRVVLADAATEAGSSKTLGLLLQDLTTGSFGYVIAEGLIEGIDTSTATAGQAVWLSATPGGRVYGTPPAEPNHMVYLGVVLRS